MKIQKIISVILAVFMLISALMFSTAAAAENGTESEIVFEEHFSGNTFDKPGSWTSHGESFESNGSMLLSNGDWPTLQMPTLDKDGIYRFSCKVMSNGVSGAGGHELLKVMHWDAKNNGRSFGSYRPGYGFIFKNLGWNDASGYSGDAVKPGVWYIMETEFCEKEGSQYTKWSVKDASGNELYTDSVNSLWSAGASQPTTASVSGEKIWFYNNADSVPLDIYVDDVMLEKIIKKSEPDPSPDPGPDPSLSVLFEQKFDDVEDIPALTSDGTWARPDKVAIEDKTLKVSPGGSILFNIKNKKNNTAYKMSYDIMVPVEGHGMGALNVYSATSPEWSLGYFNSVEGLSGVKLGFGESARIIKGTSAGKWYTVEVEFREDEALGYIIYTLIDRETKTTVGTYAAPRFEVMNGSTLVSQNSVGFWIWSRGGADETYYIDNIRLELKGDKPAFQADKVVLKDIAGNEITDFTAPITPGVAELILDFSANITQESAETSVKVMECGENGKETAVDVDGTVDGTKYILSFHELLKENTKYIIKIAKTVTTELGESLPNDCEFEFYTGSASFSIERDGIYANNTKLDSLEGIGADSSLTVKARVLNSTADMKKIVVCMSYFDGGKMVGTSVAVADVDAASGGTIEKTFTVPENMTDVDSVQAVFWNGASEALPYCNSIVLRK